MTTVTVCIPSIPGRERLLRRALLSVLGQTRPADAIAVVVDTERAGAAATRNRTIEAAATEWVAFLDDDDELLPHHLEHLLAEAATSGADIVYPWHHIIGPDGRQLPDLLGAQGVAFDPAELDRRNWVPVTLLARRSALVDVGMFPRPGSPEWPHTECEDWGAWRRLRDAGYRFHHTPAVTWLWHHHGRNTSGRPDR